MKTTVDIDTALLGRAKQLLNTRTIKDTVEKSLETVIRRDALERLANAAGSLDVDFTAASLRRQRRKRTPRAAR